MVIGSIPEDLVRGDGAVLNLGETAAIVIAAYFLGEPLMCVPVPGGGEGSGEKEEAEDGWK